MTIGAPRSYAIRDFAKKLWVSYTSLFLNNPASKVIQAKAEKIFADHVTLDNGEKVEFDYLVIATGSTIPAPGKTTKFDSKGKYEWIE